MVVDSGSGYRSGHADKSKARRLSVPTCQHPPGLLALLAAQSPDTGVPVLCRTATRFSLRHLLFFWLKVLPTYLACTTFCLQPRSSVRAPLFFTKSNHAPARAE